MWSLAGEVGLDQNSPYAYIIVCRDFAGTSVVAYVGNTDPPAGDTPEPLDADADADAGAGGAPATRGDPAVAGFVSGYLRPEAPDTLFVWQVAVHPRYRGRRVALAMLHSLWLRHIPAGLMFVEATVTGSNVASDRLFAAFAAMVGAPLARSAMFDAALFPVDHEGELLYRIGPLPPRPTTAVESIPESSLSQNSPEQAISRTKDQPVVCSERISDQRERTQ
jgi:diaminobutyrate acetyltransferase